MAEQPETGPRAVAPPGPEPESPPVPEPPADHPICTVAFCPICTLVSVAGESRPEIARHLLAAGLEVMLAFKSVLDSRTGGGGDGSKKKVQKIAID